ncbi:hypothetical protein AN639_12115 [Candidatus Epulonipiscium fishelsonii]|uniref:Uncharacterized protein n=1 Tax=Candidatus Epulonipiscium fishelsonii TaxID=77094 RepID=A0ACC8X7T4_9FIRM|nr:hypothetical protein AN396_12555 [Epulopiscium sp. SCG-B11WGA-EpuloA1]ONI42672.1 hypothetical protein AN639_12115 [Epulopiscium sp. SCG-B05WGA-EpuloA1]
MNNNTTQLGEEKITTLLMKFSVPAIIAMIVNAIYNIIDRVFVGQFVGESALAALTVVFPFMMIVFAIANLIGNGGVSLISICLGEQNKAKANHVFGNMLCAVLGFIAVIVFCAFIGMDNLLAILGADADVIVYARDYLEIILIGFIPQTISFCLNGVVRTEGKPILAMQSMLIGAISNIILDAVFIVGFGWGVKGAAWATIMGQLLSLAVLLPYFIKKQSIVRLYPKNLIINFNLLGKIMSIGASSFMMTAGTSFAMIVLNTYLATYGGNSALTAMGAINSLFTLFFMPLMGIQQGTQPIIGYNHGANKHDRVRQTLLQGLKITTAFSIIMFLLLETFPEMFIGMFLDKTSDTMNIAVQGLRLYVLSVPVISINIIAMGYFQAIASSLKAIILGASRQFILLIPAVMILAPTFGLTGVWMATPIADCIAVALSVVMLIPVVVNKNLASVIENS